MIVKSAVRHNVNVFGFCKHWTKRAYNAIPSAFVEPLDSETLFVFVAGCGHSGTTLMAAKLSNHSSIMGIGKETEVFTPGDYSLPAVKAVADQWRYFAEFNGRGCVLEKTPKHVYAYEAVQKVLPNNKFLIMTRNPLDTIASLYKRFGDLDFCIERWVFDNQEALRHRHRKNVLFVKYEDFTKSPERKLTEITRFLGLEHEPSLLESNESVYSRTRQADNMRLREEQVSKPIKPNLGGWRKVFDDKQASEIVNRVMDTAVALGYRQDALKE